jgi:flagellar basal-body rod modification protein FlgD
MPTTAVGAAGGPSTITQAIAGNQQLGQQEFLKLLITQLTNQDPLSPQDDKAFLAQMAQFSTVEGITNMTKNLGQFQAASLIGKTIDANVVDSSGVAKAVSGVVNAVKLLSDGPHLIVNGTDITMDQVQQVRDK